MHPEIVRGNPGSCPICGMTLEPRTAALNETENPELEDMQRRFWVAAALTVPIVIQAMGMYIPRLPLDQLASPRTWAWIEFILATPVVLWGGWLFFVRGWRSLENRSLNMFTLIALGTGVSYVYSVVAALGSSLRMCLRPFPASEPAPL